MAAHVLAMFGVIWVLGLALLLVGASAAPEYETIWGEYDDEG